MSSFRCKLGLSKQNCVGLEQNVTDELDPSQRANLIGFSNKCQHGLQLL